MYHWRDDLSAHEEPRIKVIKTLIYGVRPSGALAERGLRLTAEKMGHLYPRAAEVINNDVYVDDCASGEMTVEERSSTNNVVRGVLGKGGFDLKGFTFSGSDPPAHLSKDGKTIMAFGMKYHPKSDKWGLNIKELNFANNNPSSSVAPSDEVFVKFSSLSLNPNSLLSILSSKNPKLIYIVFLFFPFFTNIPYSKANFDVSVFSPGNLPIKNCSAILDNSSSTPSVVSAV